MKYLKNNGFSLVELTMGLGVLGVLALITMSIFRSIQKTGIGAEQNQHLTSFYNTVRIKTNLKNCKDSLGLQTLTPSASEITLSGAVAELTDSNVTKTSMPMLSYIQLLQSNPKYNIYSAFIKINHQLKTNNNLSKEMLASVIYIKTEKDLKVIECSNKPL